MTLELALGVIAVHEYDREGVQAFTPRDIPRQTAFELVGYGLAEIFDVDETDRVEWGAISLTPWGTQQALRLFGEREH